MDLASHVFLNACQDLHGLKLLHLKRDGKIIWILEVKISIYEEGACLVQFVSWHFHPDIETSSSTAVLQVYEDIEEFLLMNMYLKIYWKIPVANIQLMDKFIHKVEMLHRLVISFLLSPNEQTTEFGVRKFPRRRMVRQFCLT